VKETGVPGESHRPAASHWQIYPTTKTASITTWDDIDPSD
jgi:hypothetical protein